MSRPIHAAVTINPIARTIGGQTRCTYETGSIAEGAGGVGGGTGVTATRASTLIILLSSSVTVEANSLQRVVSKGLIRLAKLGAQPARGPGQVLTSRLYQSREVDACSLTRYSAELMRTVAGKWTLGCCARATTDGKEIHEIKARNIF